MIETPDPKSVWHCTVMLPGTTTLVDIYKQVEFRAGSIRRNAKITYTAHYARDRRTTLLLQPALRKQAEQQALAEFTKLHELSRNLYNTL